MNLAAGTRLGPYEIQAPLGAGGMGEVYKALDTRLDRMVAIKILPHSLAGDGERLRRFQQEARAIAALNHPNLLAVHDFGAQEEIHYLVTELLEGETLRDRLRAGALPLRKCLEYALQVARGVAAAHDKGIVHRDLKPENIFLTRDGRVKILDFGLAKLSRVEAASADVESLTIGHTAQTSPGTVLGTTAYMSPEQVRGLAVDHRSDIFSFGTILFEMICGQRPFRGDTLADLMSSILQADPPEMLAPMGPVPPALERIVRHCLEKEPAERFESARDLGFGLEALTAISSTAQAAPTVAKPRSRRLIFAAAVLAALGAGGVATWLLARRTAPPAQPEFHQLTFQRGLIYGARFAPDAQTVYYSAAWNGASLQLYSTNPSSPESRALNVSNGTLFALSKGEMAISIGCRDLFFGACEGTLAVVPFSGGAPRPLAENVVSADWTPDGTQLAVIRESGGKFDLEFPLGKSIFESDTWMNNVRISPRGNAIAFIQYLAGTGDFGRVVVLDTTGKQIAHSENSVSVEGLAWAAGGREVWFGATRSHAWANAVHALALSGKERIVLRLPGMVRLHDVAADGRMLLSKDIWRSGMQYRGAKDEKERDLSWLDATVVSDISRDGRQLAFGEYGEGGGSALVSYIQTVGYSPIKLGRGYGPSFSPDGKWVLVNALSSPEHLALLPTGPGERRDLPPFDIRKFSFSGWLPGGKEIYFAGSDGHAWRIYVQDVAGGKPRPFTPPLSMPSQADVDGNLISPDATLAFGRDQDQKGWLFPLTGGEPRTIPGLEPADIWANWSSDGRAAYVYQDDKTHAPVFRLDLTTGARRPIADLGPSDAAGLVGIIPVRVSADGQTYAYTYNRSLSDLFLTEGVQ